MQRSSGRTRSVGCALVVAALVPMLAAGASTAAAQQVPGSIGLQLLDVPVKTSDDPRARLYIVDHLPPGTVIHRRIKVTNTTDSRARIRLYAAAATIRKGAFQGTAGRARNELSTWTSVSPGASRVPAGGRLTATATITVPGDAAPGERYGVVWAEVRSPAGEDGGITQVNRVGIRIYLSVGPGGPPAADFKIQSVTGTRAADGRPTVVASVKNTGGRAVDMNGTLELTDGPGGLSAGPFPAKLGTTLAIGDTEPVTIALDKQLPPAVGRPCRSAQRSAQTQGQCDDHLSAAGRVGRDQSHLRRPDGHPRPAGGGKCRSIPDQTETSGLAGPPQIPGRPRARGRAARGSPCCHTRWTAPQPRLPPTG